MRKSSAASGMAPAAYCLYQPGPQLRLSTSPLFQRTLFNKFVITSGLYTWIPLYSYQLCLSIPFAVSILYAVVHFWLGKRLQTLQLLPVVKKQRVRWADLFGTTLQNQKFFLEYYTAGHIVSMSLNQLQNNYHNWKSPPSPKLCAFQ